MTDTLTQDLAARGYTIDDTQVNARGRVLLTVSGPGLDRFPMYQNDAQDLAAGRITPEELQAARARVAGIKGY